MKKAVVTTFPMSYYDVCARTMLASFDKHWPKDIDLLIHLDCIPQDQLEKLTEDLNNIMTSGREFYICNEFSEAQKKFLDEHKDDPNATYRFQVCRFSHKVFALYRAGEYCKNSNVDYLIWLDADVVTHADLTHEILEGELLPRACETVSYLGRKDAPHSECGFVGYDIGSYGEKFIAQMLDYYVSNKVLTLSGWTDCDVFDETRKQWAHLGRNLSEGLDGWHVWPASPLGKYMAHNKGQRKFEAHKTQIAMPQQTIPKDKRIAADAFNLDIKTKNCLPHDKICDNVRENLKLIKHWASYVKPHDDEIVICSAGESLSYHEVKQWVDKGVKIVAVKHAMDRLKAWGIKPWACVLLDPRPHVEGFVKKPDKDVIYFVASMVDPSVIKTLQDNDCHVVGYHAFVGAGEDKLLPAGTMLVSGGSATATRCVGLFYECLGFKTFHCYGYDLCHLEKPNLDEKLPDGSNKNIEITLFAQSWGNKKVARTFWTEGQFLAQAKELVDLYKVDNGFTMVLYGQGMAAWQQSHWLQNKLWRDQYNAKVDTMRSKQLSLGEWEYGITGRNAD